jgi:hypothetical protein
MVLKPKPIKTNNMSTRRLSFASDTKPENFGGIKKVKPIVRNLPKRKALKGTWYYTNKGVVSGPYDAQTMRSWLEGDHMGPSLEIRMGGEGDFAELQDHFPNIEDAFCVPSLLCVYLLSCGNTMVELKGYSVKIERHVDDLCALIEAGGVNFGRAWIGDYNVGMLSDIGGAIIQWKAEEACCV